MDDLSYIKNFFDLPVFLITGTDLRVFSVMGDRVSLCAARTMFPSGIANELILRKLLAAISAAFEDLSMIEKPEDRIPAISSLILESARKSGSFPEQQAEIEGLENRLRSLV